jgi:hypothetical protein
MSQLPPTSVYPQVPGFEPPPPPKSRMGLWIGLGIAAVLVLCLGAVGIGAIVFLANRADISSNSAAQPGPSTSKAEPTRAPKPAANLSLPESIGSRQKNTDANLTKSLDSAKQQVGAFAGGSGEPVAGFYGTAEKKDLMMVFAMQVPAGSGLSSQFDLLLTTMVTATGGKSTTPETVDPGSLGGQAKCTDIDISGVPVALCAWNDDATMGFIFWYFTKVEKAKGEFASVREQIEHRA